MDMSNSDKKIIRKVKLQEKPSFILSNLDIQILNNMGDTKIHPTAKDKVNNLAGSLSSSGSALTSWLTPDNS